MEGNKEDLFTIQITMPKNLRIAPEEKVILQFSSNFLKRNYSGNIKIQPEVEFEEIYEGDRIVLKPEVNWPVGERMKISLPAGRSFLFLPIKEKEFEFTVLGYPKISYVYPFPGAGDVIIGIEDPIEVSFLTSTSDYEISFETSPEKELIIESDKEKKHFKILPKTGFQSGEEVNLKIMASYSKGEKPLLKNIFEGKFRTLPPYPNEWSADFNQRLRDARRFTQAKIKTGKYIDINLSAQVLSTFEEGEFRNSFLISSGKKGMDTPKGEYQIENKSPRPWSRAYKLFMPYWMAITSSGKYGIHELPEWPGGYKEGANHLGVPVSHGCVRLGVGAAEKVYNWAEIGTKVLIY